MKHPHNQSVLTLIFLGTLLLTTGVGNAAEDIAERKTRVIKDWFHFEIIIFSELKPDLSEEVWPDLVQSYPPDMLSLLPAENGYRAAQGWQLEDVVQYESLNLIREKPSITRKWRSAIAAWEKDQDPAVLNHASEPLALLPADAHQMDSQVKRIAASPGFKVLYHAAWQQPVMADEGKTNILIQAGEHFDDYYELDGILGIHRSRYLHVNADIWLTVFATFEDAAREKNRQERSLAKSPGTLALLQKYPDVLAYELSRNQHTPHKRYQLEENRRLREAEFNYLDHPAFGILIKYTPVEYVESAEDN